MFTEIGTLKINGTFFGQLSRYGTYPVLGYVDPNGIVIPETIHVNVPLRKEPHDKECIRRILIYVGWFKPGFYHSDGIRLSLRSGFIIGYKRTVNARQKKRYIMRIVKR
jgi:hypothetical protein